MMVTFFVLIIIRHLVFRRPKRDHNFDNHPYVYTIPKTHQRLLCPVLGSYVGCSCRMLVQ